MFHGKAFNSPYSSSTKVHERGLLSLNGCLRRQVEHRFYWIIYQLCLLVRADRVEESPSPTFSAKILVWTSTQRPPQAAKAFTRIEFLCCSLCGYLTWIIFPSHTAYKLSESFHGWWRWFNVFFKDNRRISCEKFSGFSKAFLSNASRQ